MYQIGFHHPMNKIVPHGPFLAEKRQGGPEFVKVVRLHHGRRDLRSTKPIPTNIGDKLNLH